MRKREHIGLRSLALAAGDSFEPLLREKRMAYTVDGVNAAIRGDGRRLQQVVDNLVANAIKYSPEGGTIAVSIAEEDGTASLSVADEGCGIPPEEQPLIFERFYRTDASRSSKTGGRGIGLAIVKAIVQAHGGRVSVKSEPGTGSTFTVRLPV